MAILKGNDLMMFINTGTDVAPVYTPLARATSCDLEITNEQQEVTTKTSGDFKEFISSRIEWSISTGGLVEFSETDGMLALNTALFSGADVKITVGIATKGTDTKPTGMDSAKQYYKGTVKVSSLTLNTANGGEISTYSARLTGTGQLQFVTV